MSDSIRSCAVLLCLVAVAMFAFPALAGCSSMDAQSAKHAEQAERNYTQDVNNGKTPAEAERIAADLTADFALAIGKTFTVKDPSAPYDEAWLATLDPAVKAVWLKVHELILDAHSYEIGKAQAKSWIEYEYSKR